MSERTNAVVCLACVIGLVSSAVQASEQTQTEGYKIDCAKLSVQLDPDELTGNYRESPLTVPGAPTSRANPGSLMG